MRFADEAKSGDPKKASFRVPSMLVTVSGEFLPPFSH
jgi:hypothetical protein